MIHSVYSKEERLSARINDGLVGLAVGLEDIKDIIDDLSHSLNLIIK